MRSDEVEIPISISGGGQTHLRLFAEQGARILKIDEAEAADNAEAPFQIYEGSTYEYEFEGSWCLRGPSKVVRPSRANPHTGRLIPNVHVGTLKLEVCDPEGRQRGELVLEVRSVKASYREEYRFMLKEIAERSTELLMLHSAPVVQHFTVDFEETAATLYQRFAFIKSILESREFEEAIYRVLSHPDTQWEQVRAKRDIRGIGRPSRSVLQQLVQPGNRVKLPSEHGLAERMDSVPRRVTSPSKRETIDTPENRFIKHALGSFAKLCGDFKLASQTGRRLHVEAKNLEGQLEEILSRGFFTDISPPQTLPLNSPTLQRKEGYRQVLKTWLMIDLAASLTWEGGEDVYEGRKRNVATLYEYWVFFKLLEIVEDVFEVGPLPDGDLMELSGDRLQLNLKKGRHTPLKGVCDSYSRRFNVQLSFNKSFRGPKNYPEQGSWSSTMRPDYTLSLWPVEISRKKAEHEEVIVHVHFDAKYKIQNFTSLFDLDSSEDEQESSVEEEVPVEGKFKRADLLKMHAYKDAIRRTSGAYVLYPGDVNQQIKGFHELVPGLGAFTLKPSESDDGSKELRSFLKDVLGHYLNRASQREKASYHRFDTYRTQPDPPLQERMPEPTGDERGMLPQIANVLVGPYKGGRHLEWISEHLMYNAVFSDGDLSLNMGKEAVGADYILLYSEEETVSDKLYSVKGDPVIKTGQQLRELGHPHPMREGYLSFGLRRADMSAFDKGGWDVSMLSPYEVFGGTSLPFTVTLEQLLRAKLSQ